MSYNVYDVYEDDDVCDVDDGVCCANLQPARRPIVPGLVVSWGVNGSHARVWWVAAGENACRACCWPLHEKDRCLISVAGTRTLLIVAGGVWTVTCGGQQRMTPNRPAHPIHGA